MQIYFLQSVTGVLAVADQDMFLVANGWRVPLSSKVAVSFRLFDFQSSIRHYLIALFP
jgi:hypothetical protein